MSTTDALRDVESAADCKVYSPEFTFSSAEFVAGRLLICKNCGILWATLLFPLPENAARFLLILATIR
jgi:hypothetical protein